eukprot:Em0001g703a
MPLDNTSSMLVAGTTAIKWPSIKQPGLRSIKKPGLRSIKQPGLRSIKQPGLRSIKQPGLRSIKQPGLRSIKQPGLRSIKQPGLRSIKQPGLRSIQQPGLRSTLVNCWCKADILPGGWTHIHLRPDWATVEAAEAAKCASSTRHNISLYQLNMGDTNYLILLEIATIPVRSMFRGRDVALLTRADLHTHQDYTTPLIIGGCNA